MSLGGRLRKVREEMGLSQAEFAEIAGVLRTSQGFYEREKRTPDTAYLERIAAAGVDVVYILTGFRAQAPILSPVEADLLDNFRECEEGDQNAIRRLVTRSAEARRLKTRGRPGNPQAAQAAL